MALTSFLNECSVPKATASRFGLPRPYPRPPKAWHSRKTGVGTPGAGSLKLTGWPEPSGTGWKALGSPGCREG